jgi:hypothetical protein
VKEHHDPPLSNSDANSGTKVDYRASEISPAGRIHGIVSRVGSGRTVTLIDDCGTFLHWVIDGVEERIHAGAWMSTRMVSGGFSR